MAVLALAGTSLLALPGAASAQTEVRPPWSLIPDGLDAGDRFRLIFITSTRRDAASSDIADYNTFVQQAAAAGHADIRRYSSRFRAVGSTEAVDARDNTNTRGTGTIPIYWLDGNKVADDYADFYDGTWDDEANPKDESGNDVTASFGVGAWTGSEDNGTEAIATSGHSRALGSSSSAGGSVRSGRLNDTRTTINPLSGGNSAPSNSNRFYALSPVFTVGVPPAITDVSITSSPVDGTDTFKEGASIEVTVTFDEAVEAKSSGIFTTASVNLLYRFSGQNSTAVFNYLRQDHPRKLIFSRQVRNRDERANQVWIGDSRDTTETSQVHVAGDTTIVAVSDGVAANRTFNNKRTPWKVDGQTEALMGGVCNRHPAVRDAIVAIVDDADDCSEVTNALLGTIPLGLKLDLGDKGIDSLRKADFARLNRIHWIDLHGNSLDYLPSDLFDDFTSTLRELTLSGNPLGRLPADLFGLNLIGLETLDLENTGLSTLPQGGFNNLTGLDLLNLKENDFRTFPAERLAELAGLGTLNMANAGIEHIAAGDFDDLAHLEALHLHNNDIASLPDNVLAPLVNATLIRLQGNPGFDDFAPVIEPIPTRSVQGGERVELEAVLGASPWGDNVVWEWTQTGGPTVTLNDANTATPWFDAPTRADEAATLTFEAKAIGRGTAGTHASKATGTAEVTVAGRASITDVRVTSRPRDESNTFKRGEYIEITVTFSEPIQIKNARPRNRATVQVSLDGTRSINTRQVIATYNRQERPNELIFRRVVSIDDVSANGIGIGNLDSADPPVEFRIHLEDGASITSVSDGTNVRTVSEARQTAWRVDGSSEAQTGGPCDDGRHPAVIAALKRAPVAGVVLDCNELNAATLANITSLRVWDRNTEALRVEALAARDFAGLDRLTTLRLDGNAISYVPADLFGHVPGLQVLKLNGNDIPWIPGMTFNDLTSLEELYLNGNKMETLNQNVFRNLAALETLDLKANGLTELPGAVFGDLDALDKLDLSRNALTTVPSGVFDALTETTSLNLSDNELASLPNRVFANLTRLAPLGLRLSGNPGFDDFLPVIEVTTPAQRIDPNATGALGAAAKANPWGDNLVWDWTQTDATGEKATLTDEDSATPQFKAPIPQTETELTFEVTGTGRGTTGANNPRNASAEATVTVEDKVGPTLSDLSNVETTTGNILYLLFTENLGGTEDTWPEPGDFTVTVDGTEVFVEELEVGVAQIQLNLDTRIRSGQAVTVSYAGPTNGRAITDVAGNRANAFADEELVNNSTFVSGDATVTDITLSYGDTRVALNRFVNPNVFAYTASVPNWVSQITVAATTSDSHATYKLSDGTNRLTDADGNTPGRQVALAPGDNSIQVQVTAENNSSMFTYRLTVTRATASTSCVTGDIWCATLEVEELLNLHDVVIGYGFSEGIGGDVSPKQFTYAAPPTEYTVQILTLRYTPSPAVLRFRLNRRSNTAFGNDGFVLYLDGAPINFRDATYSSQTFEWEATTRVVFPSWSDGDSVGIRLVEITTNTPAMGTPGVSGFAVVGQDLTLSRGSIADADGLPSTTFPSGYAIQWVRVDSGGDETEIAGATSTTYTVTTRDIGHTLKAKVSFADGGGALETTTSGATPKVIDEAACGADDLWCTTLVAATLRSGQAIAGYGYAEGMGGTLLDAEFTHDGTDYTITGIIIGTGPSPALSMTMDPDGQTTFNSDQFALRVGNKTFNFERARAFGTFRWPNSGLSWSHGTRATVRLIQNNPATGTPAIRGTAQSGQTLTAEQGDIADPDELPTATFPTDYTFQWVRVDSVNTEMPIAGATERSYVPADADVGHTLNVEVTFTDGAGFSETRASDATSTVLARDGGCATRTGNDWCTTMTAGVVTDQGVTTTGFSTTEMLGSLDDPSVDYGPGYTVQGIETNDETGADHVTVALDAFVPRGSVFDLGGSAFIADADSEQTTAGLYVWDRPANFAWSDGQKVTVSANLAPGVESVAVNSRALAITYAEELKAGAVPADTAYTVKEGNTTVPTSGRVTITGKVVTIGLVGGVGAGTTVTVSYTPSPTGAVQDRSGLKAPALTDEPVTNATGVTSAALVSNTNLSGASETTQIAAQRFGTGPNANGYTITTVKMKIGTATGKDTTVVIREDDSGQPGAKTATLENPGAWTDDATSEFTVPPATTLEANRHYWLTVNEGVAENDRVGFKTNGNDAQTSPVDWTIANTSLGRARGRDSWTSSSHSLLFAIEGRANVASAEASLGALVLTDTDTGTALALRPGFSRNHLDYIIPVGEAVSRLTVSATGKDANATFQWFDGEGGPLQDADSNARGLQVALAYGENVIKVRVTALDSVTRKEYTVTITRAEPFQCAAPAIPPTRLVWEGTITVGQGEPIRSWTAGKGYSTPTIVTDQRYGALSDRTFNLQGTPYTVERLTRYEAGRIAVLLLDLDTQMLPAARRALSLHVCNRAFELVRASGPDDLGQHTWAIEPHWYRPDTTPWPELQWPFGARVHVALARTVSTGGQEQEEGGEEESNDAHAPLTAQFTNVPVQHDGTNEVELQIEFSETPHGTGGNPPSMRNPAIRDAIEATGGQVRRVARINRSPTNRKVFVVPSGNGPITVELEPRTDCADPGAVCTGDGRMLANAALARIPGPPGISVADARVEEGPGAVLAFAVTLDQRARLPVSVDYATSDGTATEGDDYTATAGTLSFAPGEDEKTVTVPVRDDSHDEGDETMTVTLSNPSGGYLADAEATGTIENTDSMPHAWLARFGRTVGEQVLDTIDDRMRTVGQTRAYVTVAGRQMTGASEEAKTEALARWLESETCRDERSAAWDCGTHNAGEREIDAVQALTGTTFTLTEGGPETGYATLWGRGALTRFDGQENELSLEGEAASLMLGADWARERSTLGLVLAHTRGEGTWQGSDNGEVTSTITGLYPWGRYEASERLTLWGATGYGAGTLTMKPDSAEVLETDMDLAMAAAGARGVLRRARAAGDAQIALKTDAMAVRTTSDAIHGGGTRGGNLAAASTRVTRLRLGVESTWEGLGIGAGTLSPQIEVGARHDGGDAESGFGIDVGAGLAWSDAQAGTRVEASARTLLSHESDGFDDRALAGQIAWDPSPDSERGPNLTLTRTMGGATRGGLDALFERPTLEGIGASAEDDAARERWELDLGYAMPVLDDKFTSTPQFRAAWSESVHETVLRWRLAEARRSGLVFGLDVEGSRRESTSEDTRPVHRIGLGAGWQLEGAADTSFEIRLEGARTSTVGGDAPEHRIGIRMSAHW